MKLTTLIVGAAFGISAAAQAAVTTTGPFMGDANETFENVGPIGMTQGPADVFGGAGQVYDNLANGLMIATSLQSGATGEIIFPYNGNLMGGSVTGWMTWEFDQPLSDFGGYMGCVDNFTGGHIEFYDEAGAVIDDLQMDITFNEWNWYGWHSDTPFTKVIVYAQASPGLGMVYDDMRITYAIPAPGALALFGLCGVASRRRRRA